VGCNCGKVRRQGTREAANTVPASRTYVDPTRALFAAAKPSYEVVPVGGGGRGKRFSTLAAAQDYARKSGGVLRSI
jgi:hypothetical protein